MQQPGQQQKGIDIVVQGRIVWGGVKQQIKKVYGTQTPAINPKTNEQIVEWAFGLAIPKLAPESNQNEIANLQVIWNAICSEGARMGFQPPAIVPKGQAMQMPTQGFHWKFDDGDGRKPDGSPYPEHSRGCIIVACKTRIPLKLMAWENGKCVQVTEDQIKCGDYVQVALNIEAHGNPNAGLYINPSFVARFAYGEAIVNQVDPTTIFGNAPPPIPFGGSATPMGGGFMQAPGFGGGNGPSAQSGSFGVPGMAAPAAAQQAPAPVQPNYGVLPGQFQQPGQGVSPAPGGGQYPQNGSGAGTYPVQGGAPVGQQGMPTMQPGQFNPGQQAPMPGYPGAPTGNPMAGPGVPQNTQAQPQQVWQPPGMPGQYNGQ